MNNLHQIGIALHDYADMHHRMPSATIPNSVLEPDQRLSWAVQLLPFLEEDGLYRQFDKKAGWEAETNRWLSHTPVPIFQCSTWGRAFPSERPWKDTYVGIAGVGSEAARLPLSDANIGVFGYDRQITFADVKDGTSNTMMVLESGWKTGSWAQGGFSTVRGFEPKDKPYMGNGRPFSGTHLIESSLLTRGHSIGCNAMMVDGSVRFLNDSISPEVLEAMATIAGGEKMPEDH
jgi:hypothetical protein